MTQFLNDKETALGKDFWETSKTVFQARTTALGQFKANPHQVQKYLETIKKYSDIAGYLTDAQWLKVADYILSNGDKVGTLNFYVDVFKLIFGSNAEVEFELTNPSPGILGITITYVGGGLHPRIVDNGAIRITNANDIRVASVIDEDITIANIRGLLSKIVPAGIYAQITIRAITED